MQHFQPLSVLYTLVEMRDIRPNLEMMMWRKTKVPGAQLGISKVPGAQLRISKEECPNMKRGIRKTRKSRLQYRPFS